MHYSNVIVGAGISGITIANLLAEKGESVLLVEKRNHIGGNCYDFYDENGILIQKYGPHIFHTSHEDVWNYVNKFSEFTTYKHKVVGFVDGNIIPIPFNMNSLYTSFPLAFAKKIEASLLKYFEYGSKVSIIELREKAAKEKNQELNFIADYIFEKIFKNYTIKQRGIKPEDINPNVLKRVPVAISRDDRYFPNNRYQGMPKNGYTEMFQAMLKNKNIQILVKTNYKEIIKNITYENIYITSPIDEFFDFKYGKLEYRNTEYIFEYHNEQSFQENSVVNYPNDYEYTRITEFKKFYPESTTFKIKKTSICKEIPGKGNIEVYPVESEQNLQTLEKYKKEASKLKNVHFLGRLANYRYFDMDQTIKNVLDFISNTAGK